MSDLLETASFNGFYGDTYLYDPRTLAVPRDDGQTEELG